MEVALEAGAEGFDALGGPTLGFVFGDALQPAVDDGADVAGGCAGPGEFDSYPLSTNASIVCARAGNALSTTLSAVTSGTASTSASAMNSAS